MCTCADVAMAVVLALLVGLGGGGLLVYWRLHRNGSHPPERGP